MSHNQSQALKSSPLLKKYGQMLYAIILIILIPAVIIGNTLWVIHSFRKVTDAQLQRQGLLINDVLTAGVLNSANDLTSIQTTLTRLLASEKEELRAFDVLVPDGSNFRVTASSFPTNVGTIFTNTSSPAMVQTIGLAWATNEGIARLTSPAEDALTANATLEDRPYWNILYPVFDDHGEKFALLNLKMSTKSIDESITRALITSEIILVITLIIVILLLLANNRLFQFAFMYRKLQEINQMKDEFISMASHELRTPITAIKGYISMFSDGSFGIISDPAKKSIDIIEASIRRLGNLVEDLLSVSRIEQNRLQLNAKPTNLDEVITQTIDELAITASVKHLELKYLPNDKLPLVSADKDKLRQVLVNLIGNAIKYTKQGSVAVSVTPEDHTLKIRIKDTGIGIAAPDREQLFTKFYRIKNEETKGITGTGLGLWITKQLIILMGGEIFVDSIEGTGTEISFTLPVAQQRPATT